MFYNPISRGSVALITEDADLYFEGKIDGSAVNRDWSFIASLRAFLGHRIGDRSIGFVSTELSAPDDWDGWYTDTANTFRLGMNLKYTIYPISKMPWAT